MDVAWVPVIVATVTGISGLVLAVVQFHQNRRLRTAQTKSTEADYGDKLIRAAMSLVDELRDEILCLRDRLKEELTYEKLDEEVLDLVHRECQKLRTEWGIEMKAIRHMMDELDLLRDEWQTEMLKTREMLDELEATCAMILGRGEEVDDE